MCERSGVDQSKEGRVSAKPETEKSVNPWAEHERRKAELPKDLSSEQRDQELRKIADELGI